MNKPAANHWSSKYMLPACLFIAVVFFPSFAGAKQVLVVSDNTSHNITLDKEMERYKVLDLLKCITDEKLKTYYGGKKSNVYAEYAKTAQFKSLEVQYNLLMGEISDLEMSIASVSQRLESLEKTATYLRSMSKLDKLTLYGIPAGEVETKQFETASSISMKCLQLIAERNSYMTGAVGNLAYEGVSSYVNEPAGQISILKKFNEENLAMSVRLKNEIAEKGKVSKGTVISLASTVNGMSKVLAKNAISVTSEEFKKYCPAQGNCVNSVFRVDYNLDKNGRKQVHELPGFLKMMLSVGGVSDAVFVDAKLTLGDVVYPEVWLPEETMLSEIKANTAAHIQRLRKLRTELTATLVQLKSKLKSVEAAMNI